MEPLPGPRPHDGQRPAHDSRTQAEQIIAAVDDVYANQPTRYRDTTPVPAFGDTPPVAQPGRPPMSQRAVDASGIMLSASVASVPLGGMTCLVLWTLDQVDPLSLTIGATAPVALVLAIGHLLRRAQGVLPDEHHHHYDGPVEQHTHIAVRQKWFGRNST